jgi:hypothetical protein
VAVVVVGFEDFIPMLGGIEHGSGGIGGLGSDRFKGLEESATEVDWYQTP